MDDILIRKMNPEDSGEVVLIYSAITGIAALETSFRRILEEQSLKDDSASLVAEIRGKVVGYMVSYILPGGFGLEKSAWIAMLGVNPKFMGQGIGDGMAREIFRFYREAGIKDIYTSVRWDSTDLLSFFKTLGFDRSNFINLHKELG